MTATRNGARRRHPSEILAREQAELLAAEIGRKVAPLVRKGLADPDGNWQDISTAQRLAAIGAFYTSYALMFERNP